MVSSNSDRVMWRNECVTYKIECSNCDSVYIGESARNAYTRGAEHTTALHNKDKDSVLYRHMQDKHTDDVNTPNFKMSVISTHKSALDRQISEALHISNRQDDDLINCKSEWGHQKIVRCVLPSMWRPATHQLIVWWGVADRSGLTEPVLSRRLLVY